MQRMKVKMKEGKKDEMQGYDSRIQGKLNSLGQDERRAKVVGWRELR